MPAIHNIRRIGKNPIRLFEFGKQFLGALDIHDWYPPYRKTLAGQERTSS